MRDALRASVAAGFDVIVTSGGTGISPTDATPEMTREVLDYEVPGIAEAIRVGRSGQGLDDFLRPRAARGGDQNQRERGGQEMMGREDHGCP